MTNARLLLLPLFASSIVPACDMSRSSGHDQSQAALEAQVPGDYATIQAAIDAASPGDVVVLAAQTYPESFALASGVTVRGAGPGQTIVYGTVTATNTSNAALESLTLSGALAGPGAVGVDAVGSNLSVSQVTVDGFSSHGVRLMDTNNAPSLDRVTITGCDGSGVHIDGAKGASVTNAVITFNGMHGVRVVDQLSPAPTVYHSLIFANGHGGNDAGVTIEKGTGVVVNSIIVSNHVGIDCLWNGCTAHHNVVWGNALDYVNWAKPGSGDVRKDPKLSAPAEGDYHLDADSPALDGGADVGPAHDFEGNDRPQGGGPDLGPFERAAVDEGFAADIVINEIMANALDESTGEYIELYNPSLGAVDVAGWIIDDGDDTDALVAFDGGTTVIPALGYAVILDLQYPGGVYDIPPEAVLLTVGNAKLGSGLSNSDPVTLSLPGGTVVDTFSHPFDAGNGVSVEKDSIEDGDIATNWVASPCGHTPGSMNCASGLATGGVAIAITEVMANPLDEPTGEWIELLNIGDGTVDLTDHIISDGDSTDDLVGWKGGSALLEPGQYALILDPNYPVGSLPLSAYTVKLTVASSTTLGNGLSNNDPISLSAPDGTTLDHFDTPFNAGNGVSMERVDPTEDTWVASTCASGSSPGEPNCASLVTTPGGTGPTTITITEVMANPLDEDTGEFVELYNHGTEPVDLAGWWIDDGDNDETLQAYEGGSTTVPPGGFAVVLDSEYASDYAIVEGTVLLTTPNTTIASGLGLQDPITVRAPDAVEPASSFGFPFNPGNGFSAQRVDLAAADVPSNWIASPCGASPGALTCDEDPPPPTDADLDLTGLVISEVLANPLDESTGELVELYNAGPTALDLAGLQFTDGDSTDFIEAFESAGPTVLAPGQFAVILDAQYPLSFPLGSALLLTVDDNSLGNGLATNDPVSILDPTTGAALATFSFPANPGNGRSIERVTAAAGDVADNWVASPCEASPGLRNCADTHAEPTGARADGQPCPNGGADCTSGVCAVDALAALWRCVSDCAGGTGCSAGFECLTTTHLDHPEVCFGEPAEVPAVPELVINELVVDGPGYDVDVFVEIAGPPGTVVDGLQLVGINGSNGSPYKAVTLAGQIGADGYFVVAHPSAPEPTLSAADMLTISVEYQNGPDSVHLIAADGTPIDAVGYGSFGASDVFAGEGSAAPDQPPGLSLSRIPDQTDTTDNAADFALADPTPGAANQLSTLPPPSIGEVLITELRVSPTAAEFIELHNPGDSPVDLSWVYLADYPAYHQITTGGGAPTSADFRLRFPAGTELAPGGYVTISLETAAHFHSEYKGLYPDFDLSQEIQAAPAMEGEYTGSASLSNGTEMLVVFYWDGATDLVTDLDYIAWGSTTQHMDKTGVTVGSSTYAAETPPAQQDTPGSPEDGALSRCYLNEGLELQTGGNGVNGEDETSEDFSQTFQLLFPPTPGEPNICQNVCTPVCDGKSCGSDGCGGSCGACLEGQVCDEGACITPAGSLPLHVVTDFELPEAFHDVQGVQLLTTAAEFEAAFGVPAPASISFPFEWTLWYSEGKRNTPGHIATVLEVVDNTSELFVFTELHLPGEACEVLELTLPTWQLVRFPAPASGATTFEQIHGEFDFDCAANGTVNGDNCSHDDLCGPELICAGTTLNYGICFPSWMHKVFPVTTPAAIPDGDPLGVTSYVQIEGLATVEMDVIIKLDITHPDPSQLTLTMFNPYNCEGDPSQWIVFWDQKPTSGPDLHLHQAVIGFSGDEYVNGPWSLKIVDNVPGGAGTLDFWSVEMTSRWD